MVSLGCEREQWAYDEALELYQEALNELPTAEEVIEAEEHLEALRNLLIYINDYPELFNDPERYKEEIERDIEELEEVLRGYYSKIEIYLDACITLYHLWEILNRIGAEDKNFENDEGTRLRLFANDKELKKKEKVLIFQHGFHYLSLGYPTSNLLL
ncbi:unnamed protein product [marine sediment metagenome]|uniref:Uncharacterized protein n=1 Tax=marine sediment metagenome TaxID=412755 RepID=X1MCU7_9ZZZZ